MIAVVIPFYQRQPGILAKALRSVFRQQHVENVTVYVVDDASPVTAESELMTIASSARFPVKIICQKNAGPGAARNKALDSVPHEANYVAFLDSDDEWSDDHLANATAALSSGYDFYFTDLYHLGQTVSAFQRAKRIVLAEHPLLRGSAFLHEYRGDMFDQILRGNVIGTPSVVYNFSRFATLRFHTEFTHAGEDYLMWMEFSRRGARFAFSSKCEVRCGEGVNVYTGSGWGTDAHPVRIQNEIRYRQMTGSVFTVTAEQRRFLSGKIAELRVAFVRDMLHRLAHRKRIPTRLLLAQLKLDPMTLVLLVPIAVRIASSALRTPEKIQ